MVHEHSAMDVGVLGNDDIDSKYAPLSSTDECEPVTRVPRNCSLRNDAPKLDQPPILQSQAIFDTLSTDQVVDSWQVDELLTF